MRKRSHTTSGENGTTNPAGNADLGLPGLDAGADGSGAAGSELREQDSHSEMSSWTPQGVKKLKEVDLTIISPAERSFRFLSRTYKSGDVLLGFFGGPGWHWGLLVQRLFCKHTGDVLFWRRPAVRSCFILTVTGSDVC